MNSARIVVMTMGHLNFTKLCLDKIFQFTNTKKYPVLVVDNHSTDGTIPYLQGLKNEGKIDVIFNDKNLGIAVGMNQGIKWAGDSDFCFVSNDIVVGYDWMENLRLAIYRDDRIGGGSPFISPEITKDEYISDGFRQYYFNNIWPRLRNDPEPNQLMNILNELYMNDFDSFTETWADTRKDLPPFYEQASMVTYLKRTTIEKVGMFDEDLVPFCNEDWDHIIRMNGFKLFRVAATNSFVHHWGSITDRKNFLDDPNLIMGDKITAEKFHQKWDLLDTSRPLKLGPKPPWECLDDEHKRPNHLWKLKNPEKYPNIPQGEHELWKDIPYFTGDKWER